MMAQARKRPPQELLSWQGPSTLSTVPKAENANLTCKSTASLKLLVSVISFQVAARKPRGIGPGIGAVPRNKQCNSASPMHTVGKGSHCCFARYCYSCTFNRSFKNPDAPNVTYRTSMSQELPPARLGLCDGGCQSRSMQLAHVAPCHTEQPGGC